MRGKKIISARVGLGNCPRPRKTRGLVRRSRGEWEKWVDDVSLRPLSPNQNKTLDPVREESVRFHRTEFLWGVAEVLRGQARPNIAQLGTVRRPKRKKNPGKAIRRNTKKKWEKERGVTKSRGGGKNL